MENEIFYFSGYENFEEDFLKWYDMGKPEVNMSELEISDIEEFFFHEAPYNEIDSFCADTSFGNICYSIFKVNERFFKISYLADTFGCYQVGLGIYEVKPEWRLA